MHGPNNLRPLGQVLADVCDAASVPLLYCGATFFLRSANPF